MSNLIYDIKAYIYKTISILKEKAEIFKYTHKIILLHNFKQYPNLFILYLPCQLYFQQEILLDSNKKKFILGSSNSN